MIRKNDHDSRAQSLPLALAFSCPHSLIPKVVPDTDQLGEEFPALDYCWGTKLTPFPPGSLAFQWGRKAGNLCKRKETSLLVLSTYSKGKV